MERQEFVLFLALLFLTGVGAACFTAGQLTQAALMGTQASRF